MQYSIDAVSGKLTIQVIFLKGLSVTVYEYIHHDTTLASYLLATK